MMVLKFFFEIRELGFNNFNSFAAHTIRWGVTYTLKLLQELLKFIILYDLAEVKVLLNLFYLRCVYLQLLLERRQLQLDTSLQLFCKIFSVI